jgi:hypothetical protein
VLGIAPTDDSTAIRRAYAAKLKVTRPEDDRAGFERLRAAYEFAMQWAGRPSPAAARSAPAESPKPNATPTEATAPRVEKREVVDPELENARQAFLELQALLKSDGGSSPEASHALTKILESPALENVSVEQRVEHQVAGLLASYIPASDPLLERAVARFRWATEADLGMTRAVATILSRLRDIHFLDALSSGKSPYSPAFRGLQNRKIRFHSWMMVHFNKTGVPGEYQLLQLMRVHHPSLLSTLEPSAIEWWDKLASRPQVSFPIILVGAVLTVLGAVIGNTSGEPNAALVNVTKVAVVFTILTLWKLFLLDWPRHLMRTRLPVPPLQLLIGWLPASLAIALLATIPAWNFVAWILAGLAICAAQWAWIVGWTGVPGTLQNVFTIPFFRVVVFNFAIGLWWVSCTSNMTPAPQLHAPVLFAMAGGALGLPMAGAVWEDRLTARQRWIWLFATSLVAIVAIACLWLLADREAWRPLAAALVVIAVLMHRHIALLFGRRQQELRFGWMVAFFIGLVFITAQSNPIFERFDVALTGFGSLLASAVLLCMLMGMWNEWRGRIAPYREDPVPEMLQ